MSPEPGRAHEGAGLYVHVPFCARACPYCDFDFEVGRAPRLRERAAAWLEGLELERRRRGEPGAPAVDRLPAQGFDTVYLGGGTPSVLEVETLRALGSWIERSFDVALAGVRESTIELNPEHVDARRLDAVAELGISRVSLGIQSLEPEGLRQLGRVHDADMGLSSARACVDRGLRTSADLIVGWPGHTPAQLDRELASLVDVGVEHVSIYALTIEAGTPWPKLVRRGLRVLPDDDLQGELLARVEARLCAAGFEHYEIASYARPGAEAIHNGKYWRFVDVVGVGPSAASVRHREGGVERRVNARGLDRWLGGGEPERERLDGERAAAEGLWLGTRRLGGLDVERFLARFAVDRAWLEARVARQLELGNLRWRDGGRRLALAEGRWLWHDEVGVGLV